ncbi:MAG: hypothetical protein BWK75_02690 [Candidatus Altiarchaeales archaeon A3]|nr:MAG: hypothetical protein BWK75_02690 [Candidatus Altiarchaeales archaeon A3]
MASEKWLIVVASFFIVMSLTTNVGFFLDGNVIELYLATVMNILATVVKAIMNRGVVGMTSLAASLVGDIHLVWAVILTFGTGVVVGGHLSIGVVDADLARGLAAGAIFANLVSVALLLMETQHEAKKEAD